MVACHQGPPPTVLRPALHDHVKAERLDVVTSIRGLPLGVRDELQRLFGGPLDIAEPGAKIRTADPAGDRTLPLRRLVVAGCSMDHCLVYYERGGPEPAWLLALFHWTPSATAREAGGIAPPGLKTVEDIRRALLSGAVQRGNTSW